MTTYRIECRTPDTASGATDTAGHAIRIPAGPWTQDGLGDPSLYTFTDRDEAERCAASLPDCGPEWAEYEYRVLEVVAP